MDGQYILRFVFSTGRIESYYSHPLDPLYHPLSQYSLAQVSYRVLVFCILYSVDPSLPVLFGTGFVSRTRILYSVLT